jgi:stage III sporulation protein AB
MRSEIVTRLTPVPELMERMALQTAVPVSSFFRNIHARLGELGSVALYDIWAQTIDAAPELLLSQEERAALRELARSLGRYDAAEQRAALERAERSFEEFARRADERRGADSKTFAALGAAAGVFIVLILI